MKKIRRIVVVGRLGAVYHGSGLRRTLVEGEEFDVETVRAHDGHYDFTLRDNGGPDNELRLSCINCPPQSFAVVDPDQPKSPPVFKIIRSKAAWNALDVGAGEVVALPKGTEIVVETVVPNDTEWSRNYLVIGTASTLRHRKVRVSGVARAHFSVLEGEGLSLWDDDELHL